MTPIIQLVDQNPYLARARARGLRRPVIVVRGLSPGR